MEKAITACPPIRPSTLLTVSQSVSSASDESNAGRTAAPRLDALTGLRFLAAAAVVVSHTQGQFDLPPGLGLWVNLGGAGVTFFFVLSGFILTYVYPRLETAEDRGRFLLARFARLWPAHVLGLVAIVALNGGTLWPGKGYGEGWQLGLNLAMLQSWIPDRRIVDAYNSPSWSISTEFGFYLAFLALIPNWRRTWGVKLLATVAIVATTVAAIHWLGWPPVTDQYRPNYATFLFYHPLARLYQFTLGMVTAHFWRNWVAGRSVGLLVGTVLELFAAGLVYLVMQHAAVLAGMAERVPWLGSPVQIILFSDQGLLLIPFAALILVMANGWGLVSRALAWGPIVVLGEISYGVYILHWPLRGYYGSHLHAYATWPGWAAYLTFWVVLLLIAHTAWVWYEQPARRILVGLWPKPGAGRPFALAEVSAAIREWMAQSEARRWARAELGLVVALLAGFGWYGASAPFHYVSRARAERLTRQCPEEVRRVWFADPRVGDLYILRGATLLPAQDGAILGRFVFESCRRQSAGIHLSLDLLDGRGKLLANVEDFPAMRRPVLKRGTVWEQRVYLPGRSLAGTDSIALRVVSRDKTALIPHRGPCDANDQLRLGLQPRAGQTLIK